MMLALLPPSSRVTRFTCSEQPAMIAWPTSVEPVKQILPTTGWVTKRQPTTEPRPGKTWNTCSGIPASRASSPTRIAVSGVRSAGFRTTVLPAASAGAKPQEAIGSRVGPERFFLMPMLFWWNAGDVTIQAVCWAGAGLSLLLIFNLLPRLSLFLLYVLYLSLFYGGQVFTTYQWDTFLLEGGFLALLL